MCICVVLLFGCASNRNQEEYEMKTYFRMLDETNPHQVGFIEPGSQREKEALDRFISFYAVFSGDVIKSRVRSVYAQNAYFRDGYKEVLGIDNIEAYFLKSAQTIHECTFDIEDVAVHEGNYYLRWIMNLTTKRWKDDPIRAVGMSHVRFDANGMIIFHQDYWDTSVIYEKVPLMGSVIRLIKQQF